MSFFPSHNQGWSGQQDFYTVMFGVAIDGDLIVSRPEMLGWNGNTVYLEIVGNIIPHDPVRMTIDGEPGTGFIGLGFPYPDP